MEERRTHESSDPHAIGLGERLCGNDERSARAEGGIIESSGRTASRENTRGPPWPVHRS